MFFIFIIRQVVRRLTWLSDRDIEAQFIKEEGIRVELEEENRKKENDVEVRLL